MSCSGLEFGTAMGACTGAVARVAGLMELGLGTWVGMSTGLIRGFGMGIDMLELPWWSRLAGYLLRLGMFR